LSCLAELALIWSAYNRAPLERTQATIDRLWALSPTPFSTSEEGEPEAEGGGRRGQGGTDTTADAWVDLDGREELACRHVVLGVLERAAGRLDRARRHLVAGLFLVEGGGVGGGGPRGKRKASKPVFDEAYTWVSVALRVEMCVLECLEAERETTEADRVSWAEGEEGSTAAAAVLWKPKLDEADRWLDEALGEKGYDMQSRLLGERSGLFFLSHGY
jgi:hypothetical protein